MLLRRPHRSPTGFTRPGLAATEFALMLPLVCMAVLACVDLGRFAYLYIMVTNAARAGAGFGADHPYYTQNVLARWQALVKQAALDEMNQTQPPAYDSAKLSVGSPQVTSSIDGTYRVSLTVTYTYHTMFFWNWPGFNFKDVWILQRTVVMRSTR